MIEQISRKLLGQWTNVKLNSIGILIKLDSGDRKPEKELLVLNSRDIGDGSVGELAGDDLIVINQVIEQDVTRGSELDAEGAIGGKRVGIDVVGKKTLGKAILAEQIVDARL